MRSFCVLLLTLSFTQSFKLKLSSKELKIRPNVSSFVHPLKIIGPESQYSLLINCNSSENAFVFFENSSICDKNMIGSKNRINKILRECYTLLKSTKSHVEFRYVITDTLSNKTMSFRQIVSSFDKVDVEIIKKEIIFTQIGKEEVFASVNENSGMSPVNFRIDSSQNWPEELKVIFKNGQISIKLTQKASKNLPSTIFFKILDDESKIVSDRLSIKLLIPLDLYDTPIWVMALSLACFGVFVILIILVSFFTRAIKSDFSTKALEINDNINFSEAQPNFNQRKISSPIVVLESIASRPKSMENLENEIKSPDSEFEDGETKEKKKSFVFKVESPSQSVDIRRFDKS